MLESEMKAARCLFAATLGLALVAGVVRADTPAAPTGTDPNAPLNPYLQTDDNGTPLAVLNPKLAPLTDEQKDALREEKAKADLDKDWLIRNYERALQNRSAANPAGFDKSNLYYELSMNPALARLAGLPDLGPTAMNPSTSGVPMKRGTAAESMAADKTPALPHAFEWKPFLPISSSPQGEGLTDPTGSQPTAMPSPLVSYPDSASPQPEKRPAPRTEKTGDILDLETPGMIASKDDPSAKLDTPDLSLDLLPGETAAQAKAERARENSIQPPQPITADTLHKSLMSSATPPGQTGATTNTASSTPPPVPQVDPEAPVPVSQQPVISPVHAPVANPFDILNR